MSEISKLLGERKLLDPDLGSVVIVEAEKAVKAFLNNRPLPDSDLVATDKYLSGFPFAESNCETPCQDGCVCSSRKPCCR